MTCKPHIEVEAFVDWQQNELFSQSIFCKQLYDHMGMFALLLLSWCKSHTKNKYKLHINILQIRIIKIVKIIDIDNNRLDIDDNRYRWIAGLK